MFLKAVEKLRPIVQAEIKKHRYPWPENVFLSLIEYESRGKIGTINPNSGASGLTQVMPNTLRSYNENTGDNVKLSTLRGKTNRDAIEQIKVGSWVLGHYWRLAYAWLMKKNKGAEIDIKDLARFADTFYAAGPYKMKQLTLKSGPITWEMWEGKHPTSNITSHANNVFEKAEQEGSDWDLEAIDKWVTSHDGKPILPDKSPAFGLLLAALVISIALYFVLKSEKKKELTNA